MSPSKCYPKWVDKSMAVLVAEGVMEKCGQDGTKDLFRMSAWGLKEQKRILHEIYESGWQVKGTDQILLRRSTREVKETRFLRPGQVAAIHWTDLPTTAAEEADVSPLIPADVTISTPDEEMAVPLFAADLKCSVEVPGEDTLLALKAMKYKQEEESDDTAEEPTTKKEKEDNSDSEYSVSKCSLDTRGYCKYHAARRNKRRRVLPNIEFAALPTNINRDESTDSDATKEMDTVDQEDAKRKLCKSDYESWETRK